MRTWTGKRPRYWPPINACRRSRCRPVNIGPVPLPSPGSFYAGLSVPCLAIVFGTAVVFCGRLMQSVSVTRLNQTIVGTGNEGEGRKKRAAGKPAALYVCRSQALGTLSNGASSGGADRIGRPTSDSLETHDLIGGDSVCVTAQTGIGLCKNAEVGRRSQSSCHGRVCNGSVTSCCVGVTVDVAGAAEPGIQVVSCHQRCHVGVLLVLRSCIRDLGSTNGAQALDGAGLVGGQPGSHKGGKGDRGNDGNNRYYN